MSIHIEDLTVRFKNGVTAINHANLNIQVERSHWTGFYIVKETMKKFREK